MLDWRQIRGTGMPWKGSISAETLFKQDSAVMAIQDVKAVPLCSGNVCRPALRAQSLKKLYVCDKNFNICSQRFPLHPNGISKETWRYNQVGGSATNFGDLAIIWMLMEVIGEIYSYHGLQR
ncbi:hypothetical protein TNCV_787791 [Trichonephila clavipes]|nr:hypothetical protein TNCV_787791 [Trichonephila clavipes]